MILETGGMETQVNMATEMEPGYQAALESAAFLHRGDRRFLEVVGVSPGDMLKGILSGTIPEPLAEVGRVGEVEAEGGAKAEAGVLAGWAHYSTALTPKGKMVSDLRLIPQAPEGFLLEVPEVGFPGLVAHFKKYLHPRFAQSRDRSRELGMISVVGPDGGDILRQVLGVTCLESVSVKHAGLDAPSGGAIGGPSARYPVRRLAHPHFGPLLILENRDLKGTPAREDRGSVVPALDIIANAEMSESLQQAAEVAGASQLSAEAWTVLRIEAGTPAFGPDMTEETIPVEAGIHEAAVDYGKGCYTGQEVIIRIRDRGQVNKSLRRILLGDAPIPEAGTEIFPVGGERSRGWITSACRSPGFGETVALAYVKRGLGPGDEVRVGGAEGPAGRVEAL